MKLPVEEVETVGRRNVRQRNRFGETTEGREKDRGGGGDKVREHQEQPNHLASANTLHCHCERELVHSSDSLKRCQRGEGGRARNGERHVG